MKNKTFGVIVIIVMVILTLSVAYLLFDKYNKSKVENEGTIENKNESLSDENSKKEVETVTVEKIVEKVVEKGVAVKYDHKKSRNVSDNSSYEGRISKKYTDFSGRIFNLLIAEDGSIKIEVTLNDGNRESIFEYLVEGIQGKVIDGYVGTWGITGDTGGFVLLEDGTVQKLTKFDSFKQNGFGSEAKIEGVKDIVRIEII